LREQREQWAAFSTSMITPIDTRKVTSWAERHRRPSSTSLPIGPTLLLALGGGMVVGALFARNSQAQHLWPIVGLLATFVLFGVGKPWNDIGVVLPVALSLGLVRCWCWAPSRSCCAPCLRVRA